MTYRFDKRSPQKFKSDIKTCTLIERKLMQVYVDWLNAGGGEHAGKYTFHDNGVDNSGEFIADNSKIHCGADFILKTAGGKDKKIEIKFCRKDLPEFHLKSKQIDRYIENDVCIINFMSVEANNPRFCIITPQTLTKWRAEKPSFKCYQMGGKISINIQNSEVKYNNVKLPD